MNKTAEKFQVCKVRDESPHLNDHSEWWFIQGYFEGDKVCRTYFMTTIFREKVEWGKNKQQKQLYYLIVSTTDPERKIHKLISQIPQDVLDHLKEANFKDSSGNLDRNLFDAYVNEIKTFGPPSPITVNKKEVICGADRLEIHWDRFSLKQEQKEFSLAFPIPGENRTCDIKMLPVKDVIDLKDLEGANLKDFDSKAYIFYPKLILSGTVGKEKVRGEAWLDHQWGDFEGCFSTTSSDNRFLGWNWLGINLEDGSDLLVAVRRDMGKKKIIDKLAVYCPKGKNPKCFKKISLLPKGTWKSPKSWVFYPVKWQLKIPELGLDVLFKPFLNDQEIPFFGILRAVWEGAGKVSGYKKDSPISGRARLELHGYGYIFDFKKYLNSFAPEIDRHIESFFPKKLNRKKTEEYLGTAHWKYSPDIYTSSITKPVWDLISRQGKRWRPLFGILALESLGIDSKPYEKLISVTLELTHTGALIIDDIEDDSLLRRGDECIHLRYGTNISLNAGNTIYFLPFRLIKDYPGLNDKQRFSLHQIYSDTLTKAHFGQSMDLYWSENLNEKNLKNWQNDSIEKKILQMYAYKTGTAVENAAKSACIIAEADPETFTAYKSIGRTFGVAFQIVDDINNFSSSVQWTKVCGEDLSSGKLTYVIMRALNHLKPSDAKKLRSIFCSEQRRKDPDQLNWAIEMIRDSGILQLCRQEAKSMLEKEWKRFSKNISSSEPKIRIRFLISGLLDFAFDV